MKLTKPAAPLIQPRLRIKLGEDIALGPGKVELLELVHQTGSITKAAKQMGLSYMRAWTLIRTMNGCFKEPLVIAARGGSKGGGGAILTETGIKALESYHHMNDACLDALRTDWTELRSLLTKRS